LAFQQSQALLVGIILVGRPVGQLALLWVPLFHPASVSVALLGHVQSYYLIMLRVGRGIRRGRNRRVSTPNTCLRP
jgi:hypothetical protein